MPDLCDEMCKHFLYREIEAWSALYERAPDAERDVAFAQKVRRAIAMSFGEGEDVVHQFAMYALGQNSRTLDAIVDALSAEQKETSK